MPPAAPAIADTDSKTAELQRAFDLFNQVSAELTTAYGALQDRVASLTEELAVANGELRRQYQEKEALSERLSLLLDIAADAVPDRIAVGPRDSGLSFAGLRAAAHAVAAWLVESAATNAVFVGLNGTALPVLLFGAAAAGLPQYSARRWAAPDGTKPGSSARRARSPAPR